MLEQKFGPFCDGKVNLIVGLYRIEKDYSETDDDEEGPCVGISLQQEGDQYEAVGVNGTVRIEGVNEYEDSFCRFLRKCHEKVNEHGWEV
jgi:hypothetical protein